MQKDHTIAKTR